MEYYQLPVAIKLPDQNCAIANCQWDVCQDPDTQSLEVDAAPIYLTPQEYPETQGDIIQQVPVQLLQ